MQDAQHETEARGLGTGTDASCEIQRHHRHGDPRQGHGRLHDRDVYHEPYLIPKCLIEHLLRQRPLRQRELGIDVGAVVSMATTIGITAGRRGRRR